MDTTLRDAERLFQQDMSIPNLSNVMRIKARGGFYQDTNVLRTDNKTYQRLLGLSLIAILENRQFSGDDIPMYSGVITGLDRSQIPSERWWSGEETRFDVSFDTAGCLWMVNLLLPENVAYDLIAPIGDGKLQLIVYGDKSNPRAKPVINTYEPGEFPFKDGRAMCQHMVDTWGKKAATWLT